MLARDKGRSEPKELNAMRTLMCLTLVYLAITSTVAHAADIASGKDHPLISRFAGAQLDGYQQIEFAAGLFYLPESTAPGVELQRDNPITVEGRVTRLLYLAPKGKSPLEVHRNYEQALKAAGVNIITAVNGTGAWWEPGQHWRNNFSTMTFQNQWAADVSPFWRDGLYLYGSIEQNGVPLHISILTAQNFSESQTQAAIAVQIIESTALQDAQVAVNAEAMQEGLSTQGKIALYGLFFEHGKASIEVASQPQLEEMAKLLKDNPGLNVYIVGHTDNQGPLAFNISLSQQRAEAVLNALVTGHSIDSKRLGAAGVASYAPVADNASEAGRAKNRRVELVLQ